MILQTLLLAATLTNPIQEPRVSARLSTNNASVGETIVLEISVERADGSVQIGMPRLPQGLVLIGTQDFTQTQISIPGGRTQTRRRDLTLQASTPGRFRIPPVEITIGSRRYRTNAVELVVTGSPQPRSIESNESAWLRATMQPDTVYVGEQSTLTVEAGFVDEIRVRLTRPPAFDLPSPTGFWVQDVPGGVQSRLRTIDGRTIETQTLQKAFFPLSSGRYAFAPARAIIDVREGFLFAPETREIRSTSPKLTVLPLPAEGRPADFRGAVGRYQIRSYIEPDSVRVGEATQLTVEITGAGNIKAAPQPVLPAIAGVEQFAPTEDAAVTFDGPIVGGTKRFQWVIIPSRTGTITIPSASYSFFDPAEEAYRTIRSAPLTLHVVASDAGDVGGGDPAATLHALRSSPEQASLQWVRSRMFIIAQGIPLLLVIFALLAVHANKHRSQAPLPLTDLKRLRQSSMPYAAFLREIERIVRAAVAQATFDERVGARASALIHRIESQRFSPSGQEAAEREALLREAEEVLASMSWDTSRKAHASALALVLALVQVPAPENFGRGVELYRDGQFSEAARAFDAVVARDSQDIAAWINLGNAHHRAGDRGRAVWAWARAAREAPRDAAITQNLRAAGAIEVLRTRPPLSVRPVEWYLLAAICWWAACLFAVYAIVRRRSTLLSWALLPVALMVIALAMGAVADGREYAVAWNDQTPLFGDPTVHSPVARRVQAGASLDVIEDRGSWLRVRTFTGAEGWVESDTVGRL